MEHSGLEEFWKINNRIYNETNQLYHRLARSCGLSDCAFWLLYTLREEEGPLTQTQLSETLSLSRQTVNAIENDKYDPTLSLAFRLAKELQLTVDELFVPA